MHFIETVSACVVLSAALAACAPKPELTPPIQAVAPAPDYDSEVVASGRLPIDTSPVAYRVELEIDPDKASYGGTVTIEVNLDRPRESIWLHSRNARVGTVSVTREGGEPLAGKLEHVGESGLSAVRLAQPVGPGRVRLTLPFEAEFGVHLTGVYKATSGRQNYVFTQFEPISAREAFPCFDEPRFKTPFELVLRVPKDKVAVANTRELSSNDFERGLREVHFAPTEKLPSYLIAFAVGALDVVPAPVLAKHVVRDRELPLRGVALAGRGPELAFGLRETPPLLLWLENYFGVAYPYDKLDLIAVPDFGAGAMENAGAITFRDTLLLVRPDAPEQQKRMFGYVDAHELAHQWFGNLVTMPWWDDIWLNEAFATWMGTRAINGVHPEYEADLGALSSTHGAMEVDSRTSARKIRQPIESDHDIENAFDAITYSKGGAVLSMFERYLGADEFQAGLRRYMERFRFGSATARDLVRTLSEVSGESALEGAFFGFLDQPGVPELQVKLDCSSSPPALELAQSRYLPLGTTARSEARWQIPFCARFGHPEGIREQCALIGDASTRLVLEAKSCPSWVMPNAGAQGYYRWSLADDALDALVARRSDLSVPEQMSLSNNVAAALRAGRIDVKRALGAQKLLAASPKRQVMESALKTYWLVRELLDEASLPAFRAEVAKMLRPAYLRLGLLPRPGAQVSGEEKLARASVVRALFGLAEDPALTRELVKQGAPLLAASTSGNPPKPASAAIPSELLELALTATLQSGGAAALDRAEAQLFEATDGVLRGRYLSALSSVRDQALGQRVLALALDARLRTNERLIPLFGQLGQPETRDRAFEWLRANYDALQAQLGAHGGNDVIAAAASFCSEEKAREVEAFFAPRSPHIAGGPRELLMTLETIRSCAALAAAYGERERVRLHVLVLVARRDSPRQRARTARPAPSYTLRPRGNDMQRFAIFAVLSAALVALSGASAAPAQAQLSRGNLRLTIDADVLSIASVERDPEDGGEADTTVFGVGPNQEGGGLYSGPPTPFGLGVGYVLQPKLILGLRFGLGLDVISPDGAANNIRRLGLSLMPNFTFVPVGNRAKLFLQVAPIFQVSRNKSDNGKDRTLLGGVGLGIGTFIFITNALSVDLGFHFEGRFGSNENALGRDTDITDLRGLVRLGVSLWT